MIRVGSHGSMTFSTSSTSFADTDTTAGAGARAGANRGASLTVVAMLSVQLGLAASVGLIEEIGPEGSAAVRLAWAGLLLPVLALLTRPRWSELTASAVRAAALLGVVTAAITLLFMAALERLPLHTASALEFLGPLGVAVWRGQGAARRWALLAAGGVLFLTQPWHGAADPVGVGFALAAAACWAAYILLTQHVGDRVPGITGLAVSMPVAGLVAILVAGTTGGSEVLARVDADVLLHGLWLALLLPVVPFILEMVALRRLTTAAFGTLMALEPGFALVVGVLILGQVPNPLAALGVGLVVAAGVGAERTGTRAPDTPAELLADEPPTARVAAG